MNMFTKSLSKLFGGNKYEKDIRAIEPLVAQTNEHFARLSSLTNDQLRGKTNEFRQRIADHLSDIDKEINSIRQEAESLDVEMVDEKDELYRRVDELIKDRDKSLEVILLELLPEAFAVVKETARRFSEHTEVRSTATDLDRDLSVNKDFVVIEGDTAIYHNEWTAAGAYQMEYGAL